MEGLDFKGYKSLGAMYLDSTTIGLVHKQMLTNQAGPEPCGLLDLELGLA